MLVQLLTRGQSTLQNAGSMQRGFTVEGNTQVNHWTQKISELSQFNRNPTEEDVMASAREAGNSSVAKVIFADNVNYKLETIQNMASMWQTEMNAYSRLAGISSQVAGAQENMLRSFAQASYQIGKGQNYTQGIANAYAQGLEMSANVM